MRWAGSISGADVAVSVILGALGPGIAAEGRPTRAGEHEAARFERETRSRRPKTAIKVPRMTLGATSAASSGAAGRAARNEGRPRERPEVERAPRVARPEVERVPARAASNERALRVRRRKTNGPRDHRGPTSAFDQGFRRRPHWGRRPKPEPCRSRSCSKRGDPSWARRAPRPGRRMPRRLPRGIRVGRSRCGPVSRWRGRTGTAAGRSGAPCSRRMSVRRLRT